ncbi:hypothetical protein BpHYR1_052046 [Brachionus plicatilis]|uniref:Uncharacterized protein n=1 Tax=Brachionus plicatilis TaxID=10195 RepID=A0A3M7RH30_BRAPC|nr:hypothetical protein BpHYR1_052046 [Brachionus plicatilis]
MSTSVPDWQKPCLDHLCDERFGCINLIYELNYLWIGALLLSLGILEFYGVSRTKYKLENFTHLKRDLHQLYSLMQPRTSSRDFKDLKKIYFYSNQKEYCIKLITDIRKFHFLRIQNFSLIVLLVGQFNCIFQAKPSSEPKNKFEYFEPQIKSYFYFRVYILTVEISTIYRINNNYPDCQSMRLNILYQQKQASNKND